MPRTHLLSGATSGIGRAIYDLLLERGDRVIPMVRTAERATELGTKAYLTCDFEEPAQVEDALASFDDEIDSFVNCAGIMQGRTVFDSTLEDVERIVNVNLVSPMIAVGRLRNNLKTGGVIVLFGSQSGFKGSYDDGYSVTKGAIHSFVKSVALKLAPDRRIVAIAPGIAQGTRMTAERAEDDLAEVTDRIPLKRLATPRELAEITWFLLSDAASYITGATIDVNGGNYLR